MPAISAARKTVVPSGTAICFPLIVICTMRSSFYLRELSFREHLTDPCGTASQTNVRFDFCSKMFEHIADRHPGGLTQAAVGCPFHFLRDTGQDIQIFEFALTLGDAVDDLIRP